MMVLQLFHQTDLRFLFDGFVRRTILTNTEGIVRPNELHRHFHQGSHADCGLHVIRENEEGSASCNDATMKHHTNATTCHREFCNACLKEASAIIVARDDCRASLKEAICLVGVAEVGRADNHVGHLFGEKHEASA